MPYGLLQFFILDTCFSDRGGEYLANCGTTGSRSPFKSDLAARANYRRQLCTRMNPWAKRMLRTGRTFLDSAF